MTSIFLPTVEATSFDDLLSEGKFVDFVKRWRARPYFLPLLCRILLLFISRQCETWLLNCHNTQTSLEPNLLLESLKQIRNYRVLVSGRLSNRLEILTRLILMNGAYSGIWSPGDCGSPKPAAEAAKTFVVLPRHPNLHKHQLNIPLPMT